MILPFGKLTNFDHKEREKREKNVSIIHQQDARTQAICIANDLIQQGDIAITSASEDDPILEDSKMFGGNFDHLNFEQGWGRRNNRSEPTLCGETYITNYKEEVFEFYEQGRK